VVFFLSAKYVATSIRVRSRVNHYASRTISS
jgi:hypothetical protein